MNIQEKYELVRPLLKDGDIIAFHGKAILSRIIQSSDKNKDGSNAYHNHIGIIIEKHRALFIADSNAQGVQVDRLSWRISKYLGGDFSIITPLVNKENVDREMARLLKRSDDKWIKYDYVNGTKELANRRWGLGLEVNLNDNKDICSDYVSRYVVNLDMVTQTFKDKIIVFPEDYFRYLNLVNAKVFATERTS